MTHMCDSDGTIKSELRSRARGLGFQLFGVAPAELLEEDLARLRSWIEQGDAAGMTFMTEAPEKRTDCRSLLEGARSVIMVGLPYAQKPSTSVKTERREGRVARFAMGDDYHAVFRPRLEDLAQWILEKTGGRSHCFVDSDPILERAYARRAGLGFIGKNNLLIHPNYGSWVLLGGLVTTLELEPDQEVVSKCGNCRKCLNACPMGALRGAYRLDARRCLSYWTIETHGTLDSEVMRRMGDCFFGCDSCQAACPFNQKTEECEETVLSSQKEGGTWSIADMTIEEILRISSNREFDQKFRGSPLLRARLKGLQRNAAVVAGNLGRRDLGAMLEIIAADEKRPFCVRDAAQWALAHIKD